MEKIEKLIKMKTQSIKKIKAKQFHSKTKTNNVTNK